MLRMAITPEHFAELFTELERDLRHQQGRWYPRDRELVQRTLGITRQTLWRYATKEGAAPAWLPFALLGAALSGGDAARAIMLLEDLLDREQ